MDRASGSIALVDFQSAVPWFLSVTFV